MCVTGRLVEPMSWGLIGVVWAYNLGWMGVMGGLRLVRSTRHAKSLDIVNQPLPPWGVVSPFRK